MPSSGFRACRHVARLKYSPDFSTPCKRMHDRLSVRKKSVNTSKPRPVITRNAARARLCNCGSLSTRSYSPEASGRESVATATCTSHMHTGHRCPTRCLTRNNIVILPCQQGRIARCASVPVLLREQQRSLWNNRRSGVCHFITMYTQSHVHGLLLCLTQQKMSPLRVNLGRRGRAAAVPLLAAGLAGSHTAPQYLTAPHIRDKLQ